MVKYSVRNLKQAVWVKIILHIDLKWDFGMLNYSFGDLKQVVRMTIY